MRFSYVDKSKRAFEAMAIFVFGGCLQVIFACNNCWGDWYRLAVTFSYAGFTWLFLTAGSLYMVALLNRWVDWLKYPLQRLGASLAGVTLLVYGSSFLIHFGFHLLVFTTAYDQIIPTYNPAEHTSTLLVTLGINAVMHGRAFLLKWKQAAIDIERMKTEQVSSQYQSLKNQVNPHFLFNSLNALSSLVYDDQKKAVRFIRRLSEVYRYVLDKKDHEVVPIAEELDFVNAYVFLQKIRFGDNLKVQYHGEKPHGFAAPLAIQLLVENAIKHNVISSRKPLTIDIRFDRNDIIVKNVIAPKKVKHSTGIGLNNLKARYGYLSNVPVEHENDGKTFKVTMPILDLK